MRSIIFICTVGHMAIIAASVILAVLLDNLLGEPKRYHPLVGFGKIANYVEKNINISPQLPVAGIFLGLIAWCLVVLPIIYLSYLVFASVKVWPLFYFFLSVFVLYTCIAWKSLNQHVTAVIRALQMNDLVLARKNIALIVSRDCDQMDKAEVCCAAIETTLENGADGIFSPLFWFILGGPIGVILYRLSNTLDAMWGYKNARFYYFGRVSARVDDLLNWIPARLVVISYALLGSTRSACRAWRTQSRDCASPNAGPVMAAGAAAINVKIGGGAVYDGQMMLKPVLGEGDDPDIQGIKKSLRLVKYTVYLWCFLIIVFGISVMAFQR